MPYREKFSKVKLVGMIKAVSSNNVSYSFGLLAGVTAPESHGLVKLEHLLNQGCPTENFFKLKLVGMIKAVSSDNVSYSFGLITGVTAPESLDLV